MVSGYEKSLDYGGKPASPLTLLAFFATFIGIGLFFAWSAARECEVVPPDAIETIEQNGAPVATVRLDRLPPKQCFTLPTK